MRLEKGVKETIKQMCVCVCVFVVTGYDKRLKLVKN